jgi:signal transduction histidine kinase
MHEMPLSVPDRLARQGLVPALRALLEQDVAAEFDGQTWQCTPTAESVAATLPLFAGEVLYFATRELLRNAARHGRGGDTSRPLHVTLHVAAENGLNITVVDDGVGLHYPNAAQEGTRTGLRFHNAMLTAIGGTLAVTPLPNGGTRAVVHLPRETLHRLNPETVSPTARHGVRSTHRPISGERK